MPPLMSHFDCSAGEKTYMMTMQTQNLKSVLANLRTRQIDFTIKKKKFFGKDNLESGSLKLTSFSSHS